jgi:uncharacterized membrane protein YcaP (DUF421 family)
MPEDSMITLAQVADALRFLFGGDFPDDPLQLHQAMARAVVVYLGGLAVVRLGKSRSIGRITPIDVLLGFVLGSLLSRGITGHASISGTMSASVGLVATHWLLTRMTCRWHRLGDLVKGHADLIVKDGEPLEQPLLKHHLSPHDLQEQLRLKGADDIRQVKLAYKERNGEVSFIMRR